MFFFNDTATTEIYTLSLHDALPIYCCWRSPTRSQRSRTRTKARAASAGSPCTVRVAEASMSATLPPEVADRSEEHTSELQSRQYLVCRLLLEKKTISRHQRPTTTSN